MAKQFNVAGICIPEKNYMVDISEKVEQIVTEYIEEGKYFTINRARQFGKTTMLYALEERLKDEYLVLSLSFEAADELFVSLYSLAEGLVRKIGRILQRQVVSQDVCEAWRRPISREFPMDDLGERITELCTRCGKKVILMVDEVDRSSDNQVFLAFLGLLREKYLEQLKGKDQTFHVVILAGVYDIKNLKLKLHPGQELKYNSPWNIAVNLRMNMSFDAGNIKTMLKEYEADYQTGMNVENIARLLYEYTSGYPYFVSRLCQILDEQIAGTPDYPDRHSTWTENGFQEAVKQILRESNMLFDDMRKRISDYPELKKMLYSILFKGVSIPYNPDNREIELGVMFGFILREGGAAVVANRIFETRLYNLFLSEEWMNNSIYNSAVQNISQFVKENKLNMELILKKFMEHFTEVYGDSEQKFVEENGRRLFLLYLKPIINGTGNYYIEARTRDMKRTDVIVDYQGQQYVVELKIWHGKEYNSRGEKQLFEYLEYYHKEKGYLLSFNFNKNKETGMKEIDYHGKKIVEVVV